MHTLFEIYFELGLHFRDISVRDVELFVKLNLLSPEPVFQASGSKMTRPEQMTISSLLKGVY